MNSFPKWKIISILSICLLLVFLALPNFTDNKHINKYIPVDKVHYGLDLKGGVQVLLKIDFPTYVTEQLNLKTDLIRRELRKNKIGYLNLKSYKDHIAFTLKDPEDKNRIRKTVARVSPDLEVLIDNNNAVEVKYFEGSLSRLKESIIDQTIEIIRYRVDEKGTLEPSLQRHGDLGISIQVPGLYDPSQLKRLLGTTAKLSFQLVDESMSVDQALKNGVPIGSKILKGPEGKDHENVMYLVQDRIVVSGDMLLDAQLSNSNSQTVVAFSFDNTGARLFADATKNNVGKRLAIVLDDRVISAPVVNEPILGGSGTISGNFTVASANEFALLLRAGSLPAPLEIGEERVVGPSLGEDYINLGTTAALIAILGVIIFMVLTYGLWGVFASIALVFNIIFVLSAMAVLHATLTMPGIAGIVLTMGMSVDSNVLIFERIKEELKLKATLQYAMKKGFEKAFSTIFDSNLTTLISAFFLYAFGSGVIKGFAVTLTIGILSSMFTAITLTKLMMYTWLSLKKS